MQLAEPEALGIFNHHDARVRHVHADFDDRRGHEDIEIPGGKLAEHLRFFVRGLCAPRQSDTKSRQFAVFQRVERRLCAANVLHHLAVLNQRTDHIRLMPFQHLLPQEAVHPGALLFRHDSRLDRRAPRRQFIDNGHVKVAIENQRKRARNRRCGHDEHMRRFRAVRALLLQGRALHHTETVLLIRHNQSELLIRHLFADQRVRPEHCLIFPVCASLLRLPLRLRAHRANQQAAVDAQRFQHCLGGFVVLARKNFRRRHHRRLVSAGACHGNRPECQRGFAAADVALHEAAHRPVAPQIRCDFLQDALLRPGRRERQRLPEFIRRIRRNRQCRAILLVSAQQPQRRLIHQHLLKRQPPPRQPQVFYIQREMRLPDGEIQLTQLMADAQVVRQRLRAAVIDLFQRLLHHFAEGLRRNPLHGAVHRQDARFRHPLRILEYGFPPALPHTPEEHDGLPDR